MEAFRPFGALRRRLRKARDFSQEALAQQVACAHDTVKKLEHGLRRPSRALAANLADLFDLESAER
jgi:transcriptional regulator with XRE-family HTH domain